MNQILLLEYVQKPAMLEYAPAEEIERLVFEFPYCQTTRLLYIKALYEQKNILFHSQLKKTAAHISDRSILYYLINGGLETEQIRNQQIKISNFSTISKENIKEQPISDLKQNFADGLTKLVERLKKIETIVLPNLEGIGLKLQNIKSEHDIRVRDIIQEYLSIRQSTETLIQETSINSEQQQIPEFSVIDEQLTAIIELPESSKMPSDLEKSQENLSKTELIEKFIGAEISMPRGKKDFYNPANMAQNSSIDHNDLASETLAEIHLKQGNIHKALKIYQHLCLIIPEKSTYFAARIENIKKENNLL